MNVIKKFGFDVPDLKPELFLKERNIVRMGVPPLRLEILMSISGVEFRMTFFVGHKLIVEVFKFLEVFGIDRHEIKKAKIDRTLI